MIIFCRRIVLVFVFFGFLTGAAVAQTSAARAECFPFETLAPAERRQAEELLLKALDGEALYTIVGGVKPMSSGFQTFRLQTSLPRVERAEAEKAVAELAAKRAEELTDDEKRRLSQSKQAIERGETLEKIAATRRILEKWRCGGDAEIFADVQHFAREFEGRRFFEAVVFSRRALRQMLGEKADFFSRWGATENSHPLAVLYAVEYEETTARNAGYGYLFGYPDNAVRFFVEAANEENLTGKFVERDFYSIPTFARETNGFVYAVPKNYAERETDKNLRARAERILSAYKKRRAEYVGEGKRGVVEMLRDWFCAAGKCSPQTARLD
jgi:hypothetical protein